MHQSFRAGFEKVAKELSLVPYHAPVDSAPPEHIERVPTTPSMGDAVQRMETKLVGQAAGAVLRAAHLPGRLAVAITAPRRIEQIVHHGQTPPTGEHSAAPVQTHEGVM